MTACDIGILLTKNCQTGKPTKSNNHEGNFAVCFVLWFRIIYIKSIWIHFLMAYVEFCNIHELLI